MGWREWIRVAWLSFGCLAGLSGVSAVGQETVDSVETKFAVAVQWFRDGFYEAADQALGEFIVSQPSSPRAAEAILLQAQARFQLQEYNQVIELLGQWIESAGKFTDQYYYWLAQAYEQGGDFETAATAYEKLLENFPESSYRLEAAVGQAYAHFNQGDFTGTIQLLKDPEGAFEAANKKSANMPLVARGYLLLVEALRAERDYKTAEEVLDELAARNPGAEIEWQRQSLLARLELADGRPEAAHERATNLVALAKAAEEPLLVAQSLRLTAEILERSKPVEALNVYEEITTLEGLPAEGRRQALLKMVDLTGTLNQLDSSIQRLETFLEQNPEDVSRDLLRLTLGELRLKQYYIVKPANVVESTNRLAMARAEFDRIIEGQTNSSYLGKAWLGRGWCWWEQGMEVNGTNSVVQARASYERALEHLGFGEDKAVAQFKLADCQMQLKEFGKAIEQYEQVLANYGNLPRVREQWFDQALYQITRAAIEQEDLDRGMQAADRLAGEFPESPYLDRALLVMGQALMMREQTEKARKVFSQLASNRPESALLPEAERAVARSYVEEGSWEEAVKQYGRWTERYTNHVLRPVVEFDYGWALAQAGREEEALSAFTNFVAAYPTNRFAPMAQYWVADHHFHKGDFVAAELNYQSKIFGALAKLHPAAADLQYQARFMAARAALRRDGYGDARGYLTNLLNDLNCPKGIIPEAYFLMGEVQLEEPVNGATNLLQNFETALSAFNTITNRFADHRLVPLALGKIGDCHLQLASRNPKRYEDATNAYGRVLQLPRASVKVRSQAETGLGIAYERMAEEKKGEARKELQRLALRHYQNVAYGYNLRQGEHMDLFWVKEAGLAAGRVAEALGQREQAVNLYRRLMELLPAVRPVLEKRVQDLAKASG